MAQALSVQATRAIPWRAYGALAVGIICIGWSAIFVRLAGVSGPASAFYRVLISAVIVIPWWLGRRRSHFSPRVMRIALLSGVFFGLDLVLWNTSILLTSAATSTLLAASAPIWVGLGAFVVFHERLNVPFWVGMTISLLGAVVIVGQDLLRTAHPGPGDLLAMLAGVSYGFYLLTMSRVRSQLDTLSAMTFSVISSTVLLFAICLLFRVPLGGYPTPAWLALLGLGLISQLSGWLAINYALGHIPATITSVSLLIQPVLTTLFAIPILHEPVHVEQAVGGALVLGGVLLVHSRTSVVRAVADRHG